MWFAETAPGVVAQPGTTTTAILVAALSSVLIAFIGAYYRRDKDRGETEVTASAAEATTAGRVAELGTQSAVHEYRLDDLTRRVERLEDAERGRRRESPRPR